MNHIAVSSAALLAGLWAACPVASAQSSGNDVGKFLFEQQCAICHGPDGRGGRGANLAKPRLEHAANDADVRRIIKNGIPGTEMPGSFQLAPDEIGEVAAFVESLGEIPEQPVSGDTARGRKIVDARCVSCHYVDGHGAVVGPALTGIGSRRGAAWLKAKIADPAKDVAQDFRIVDLTTRDGRKIRAIRANEDTWSIQVRDLKGNLLSFWKSDLESLKQEPGKTLMPAYKGILSDSELDDVTAYLVSQKEARR